MTVAIGLAGAGHRATRVHAPTLAGCPDAHFAGVWARSSDAARAIAEQYDVPLCERFTELLGHCDAVAFAVPPPVQAELAAVAARRGKAVFLERPVAGEVAAAEDLAAAVQAGKVISQLALAWRYSADVRRFLSEEVSQVRASGATGRLVCDRHVALGAVSAWRLERGILHDQGLDVLDLLEAMLGPIVGVQAHGDPQGWIGVMLDHQVDRFSEATMWVASSPEAVRADIEIFGPGGSATLDCTALCGPETYQTMFREFAEAVQRGIPSALDVRHGVHLQRVIEAADTDVLVGA